MKTAPGVHHFETGPFNWYVLEQGSRLTLVDAGFPGHYGAFRRGLAEIGRSLADVEALILTHAHADHVGFMARLGAERKGVPVMAHAADREAAGRSLQLPWWGLLSRGWRPFTASMLAHATCHGVFWGPGVRVTRPVADGEVLDVPGKPRVIHVPGHTPGQIALWLAEPRVLLSSDVLVTRHLYSGRRGAPMLAPAPLNHDAGLAKRGLAKLRGLGAEVTVLPGHGAAWCGNLDPVIDAL